MLKGADLFCDIGGFRIGMERHGIECVLSSDIDKFARQTYRANFGDEPQRADTEGVCKAYGIQR